MVHDRFCQTVLQFFIIDISFDIVGQVLKIVQICKIDQSFQYLSEARLSKG